MDIDTSPETVEVKKELRAAFQFEGGVFPTGQRGRKGIWTVHSPSHAAMLGRAFGAASFEMVMNRYGRSNNGSAIRIEPELIAQGVFGELMTIDDVISDRSGLNDIESILTDMKLNRVDVAYRTTDGRITPLSPQMHLYDRRTGELTHIAAEISEPA